MPALKELCVINRRADEFLDLRNLNKAVELQLEYNPPSIGIHLGAKPYSAYNHEAYMTLLAKAIKANDSRTIYLLIEFGADPLRNLRTEISAFSKYSHVRYAFDDSWYVVLAPYVSLR